MNYTADPLIKVGLRPDYSEAFNEMNNAIAGIATTSSSFWEANNNGIRYTNHIATGQATVDTAGTPVTQLNGTVSAIINNQGTFTNGSIALNATVVNAMLADPTANNASAWIGQDGVVEIKTGNNKNFTNLVAGDAGAIYHLGSGTINTANAMVGILENNSTGVMTDGVGIRSLILHSGSGAITSEYGVQIQTLYLGSNPVTNHYGVRVTPPTNLGGTTTITNNYGIYIDDHTTLGTTLKYNLYSAGTTALHRIEGSLQVGDLTMTDAKNIILNTSTGTKIGTSTSQKLAFFNSTPVVQQGSDVNSLVTYGLMSSISNLTFTKETTATIKPADTTTAATVGATLSIVGGKGSNTTSGAGGPVSITGGDGRQGNSAGGAVNHTGGTGVGFAAGGAINIKGGSGFIGGNVLIDVGGGFAGAVMKIGSVNSTMVALGNFTPTATIHIKAGTTSASSAPLKFTTGSNMTTAEVGAMEFSSNVLYFTPSGTNRYAVLLDTIPDSQNITLGTSTGSVIGTATTQKLGFWNATPVVQPTTAVAAATFTANTSGIVNDSATFDGYTMGQVVKALRNTGILA